MHHTACYQELKRGGVVNTGLPMFIKLKLIFSRKPQDKIHSCKICKNFANKKLKCNGK
jgi:hypothetical protein